VIRRLLSALVGGTIRAVSARVLSILASFLLTIAVARMLGAEAAGSFFLAFTTLAVIATFGRFGTDNLALKLVGGDSKDVRRELLFGALVSIAAGVLAAFVASLALLTTGYALPGFDARLDLLVLSSVVPQALAVTAGAVLRARGQMARGTFAELGSTPTITIGVMGLLAFNGELNLTKALLALTVASWATAVWSIPAALSSLRGLPAAATTEVTFRHFVKSRTWQLASMMGTSLLFYVLTWSPLYALTISGSLSSVSYFTTAARLANIVSLVPVIQVAYLAPAFARHFHRKELLLLNELSSKSAGQAAALILVPVVVLSLGAGPIVTWLYGREFAPAALPLAILVLGTFVVSLAGQVNQLMLLCNLESHALALSAILVLVWAAVGLWIAATFGAEGVAWFTTLLNVLYALVAATILRVLRGVRSNWTLPRRTREV
jgi:O-antigen/teichoic acid export membrane protein